MLSLLKIIDEAVIFTEDNRQTKKVKYPLKELLLQSLLAVLSGMETYEEIVLYGTMKIDFLRRFYPFECGTASEATLCRFFSWVAPNCFLQILMAWIKILAPNLHNELIAIDGKTIRGSHDGFQRPVHVLSAFLGASKLVIGHLKIGEKTNEISMLPELIEMLDIEGAIVSLDAMGTQRTVAEKILAKKGDYLLALKGNQGNLEKDTKELFESMVSNTQNYHVSVFTETKANGSRVETRHYTVTDNIVRLQGLHEWEGLQTVIKVDRKREYKNGKNMGKLTETETAYYLCSRVLSAEQVAGYVRGHWETPNSLHYVLDVSYQEDRSRIRKNNAAENMNILRKITTNMIRTVKDKKSFKYHRKALLLNDKTVIKLIQ